MRNRVRCHWTDARKIVFKYTRNGIIRSIFCIATQLTRTIYCAPYSGQKNDFEKVFRRNRSNKEVVSCTRITRLSSNEYAKYVPLIKYARYRLTLLWIPEFNMHKFSWFCWISIWHFTYQIDTPQYTFFTATKSRVTLILARIRIDFSCPTSNSWKFYSLFSVLSRNAIKLIIL